MLTGCRCFIWIFVVGQDSKLPGATVKDAADWVAAGGTKEELMKMACGITEWAPQAVKASTKPTIIVNDRFLRGYRCPFVAGSNLQMTPQLYSSEADRLSTLSLLKIMVDRLSG